MSRPELKSPDLHPLGALPGRKALGQHVFETLKEAIIQGGVAPGDRLVENRLAEALDISRTPVREAIHKLEREGWLRRLPRGGFTVMSLTRADIEETFGIRSVLESYAARLATLKHREEDRKELEEKFLANIQQLVLPHVEKLKKLFLTGRETCRLSSSGTRGEQFWILFSLLPARRG